MKGHTSSHALSRIIRMTPSHSQGGLAVAIGKKRPGLQAAPASSLRPCGYAALRRVIRRATFCARCRRVAGDGEGGV